MDILGQSAVLVAITSLALGSSVVVRNVRNKLYLAFAVTSALTSAWALFFFLGRVYSAGPFYRLHLLANLWLAPVGLAFVRLMVRIQNRSSRRFLDVTVLLSLALSVALLFHIDREYGWVAWLIDFLPGTIILQVFQLMWTDRKLRLGAKLEPKLPTVGLVSRNLIYLGALFVLCTSTMDHVRWTGHIIPTIGNLGLCVYLYFVSQAITQQRLLNFSAMLARTVVLGGMAFVLTVIYSMLVGWVKNSPGMFFLNSFIASLVVLTLLEPLGSVVRFLTQRLGTKEQRRLQQALRDAESRLAGIVDPERLSEELLRLTLETLQPEWSAIFLLRGDGTVFQRVRTSGQEPETGELAGVRPTRAVLADSKLIRHASRLQARGSLPILLDQILEGEIDRSASRVQREQLGATVRGLRAIGANMMIPLFDGERMIGFVTLLAPHPPEPWGSNWGLLPIVYPYYERAAETLRNMEVFARAREKERLAAIGEMAAGLAHEIRNPLGAIKGAAQFLDPTSDRPESRFLRVIIEETDRLNRVVSQFLDYSKPWAAELRPFDLAQAASRAVEAIRPGAPSSLRLEYSPPSGQVPVLGSPEQIQQIVINLVQNAFRALEPRSSGGSVRVMVSGCGPDAVLLVEDDGPGIPQENLAKIFIPFFTTSPSGTGLGLAICQKIVEAHRGRIEVTSEVGRGTRVQVVLPRSNQAGERNE